VACPQGLIPAVEEWGERALFYDGLTPGSVRVETETDLSPDEARQKGMDCPNILSLTIYMVPPASQSLSSFLSEGVAFSGQGPSFSVHLWMDVCTIGRPYIPSFLSCQRSDRGCWSHLTRSGRHLSTGAHPTHPPAAADSPLRCFPWDLILTNE